MKLICHGVCANNRKLATEKARHDQDNCCRVALIKYWQTHSHIYFDYQLENAHCKVAKFDFLLDCQHRFTRSLPIWSAMFFLYLGHRFMYSQNWLLKLLLLFSNISSIALAPKKVSAQCLVCSWFVLSRLNYMQIDFGFGVLLHISKHAFHLRCPNANE